MNNQGGRERYESRELERGYGVDRGGWREMRGEGMVWWSESILGEGGGKRGRGGVNRETSREIKYMEK